MKTINKSRLKSIEGLYILAATAVCFSCSQTKTTLIDPPIPSLAPEYSSYIINNDTGGKITLNSGTTITIPAKAIVDSIGNPVKGNVEIRYREFHDAASIFLSGIPMHFNDNGKNKNFQTAGMFDIYAAQNGKNMKIGSGKNINVSLGSFTDGNDYDFWYLDQNAGSWKYTSRSDADSNITKIERKKEIDKLQNVLQSSIKIPFDSSYFVFNYNSILDIYYNEDYFRLYERHDKDKPKVISKAQKYGLQWYDICPNEYIVYHGLWVSGGLMVWKMQPDIKFPDWADGSSYQNKNNDNSGYYISSALKNIKGYNYTISLYLVKWWHLYNNDGAYIKYCRDTIKSFSTRIEAVMPLKILFAFTPEYLTKNYDEAMKKMLEEQERLKQEADFLRTASINQFGIYNYDRFLKDSNNIIINAVFEFNITFNNELVDINTVFCITGDNRSVIKYHEREWDKVAIFPGVKAKFLAVLPGSAIAVFSVQRYLKINTDSLRAIENPEYSFNMKALPGTVSSEECFRKDLIDYQIFNKFN
ncbi:MAG: hypothetical protein HY738_18985 [Bacteroidia bacterium]|nr:hypothetical protein [Bacteroidia bacterium]